MSDDEVRAVKCPVIGCSTPPIMASRSNPHVAVQDAGYTCVMNQANGLTMEYVCPSCAPKMTAALATLMEMFGEKTSYMYFVAVIRKMEKAGQ